jgi:hypothetical protein
MLVWELQFRVKHPEAGVKTQPHIAILIFKSYPSQCLCGTHTTLCLPFWGHWITVLHFELAGGRAGLPCGVVWGQITLPSPVILWIRCVQGKDCLLSVCCLSVCLSLSLSLFVLSFHCHFQVPCFSLKAFPKYMYPALRIQLVGTCIANRTCLQQTVFCSLQSSVIKPYHSFLYIELCLKSLRRCLQLNPNSMNSNRDCFLSTECVYVWLIC